MSAVSTMTMPANMRTTKRRPARVQQFVIIAALALLVPAMTKSLVWAGEAGLLPLKPRDYTLLTLAAAGLFVCLNKPSFSPAALLILVVPLARVLDAAFLQRFSVIDLGDHFTVVLSLISNFLVSLTAVLLLSVEPWRRVAIWVAVTTSLVSAGCVYYEWAGFESFTRISGRMSGFPEDPNDPPIIISLMVASVLSLNPRFWWNTMLIALVAPAIALTLSRSGMAVFSVLVLCYLLANLRAHFLGMALATIITVPLAISGVAILAESSSKQGLITDKNTTDRLKAIYELDFERIKSPERGKDLQDGWEAVGKEPIFGHGSGAGTSHWKPHNQIVALWLDIGVFGMLFYMIWLLLLTGRSLLLRLRGFYCLVPLWLFIPCSQILVESPHYWFAAAVCCNLVFKSRFRVALRSPAKRSLPPAGSLQLP